MQVLTCSAAALARLLTRAAFLASLLLAAPAASAAGAPLHHIVIDAGSSGSRIYLYEVVPGPYPEITQVMSFKGIPGDEGIDNFLDNGGGINRDMGPEAVRTAVIAPLLEKVAPALAERGLKKEDIAVDFLATAGMRSAIWPAGKHQPSKAEALYEEVRKAIAAEGFVAGEVRTTDGSAEEGVWTWIDLNDRYRDAFRSDKAPVGVVEVGGSSMQVGFPVSAAADPARNIYAVKINGRSFSVFDRTYLGLGQDDARKSMRMMDPPGDGGTRCFPAGMTAAEDAGDVIGSQTVKMTGPARYDAAACGQSYAAILKRHFETSGRPEVGQSTAPFYGFGAIRHAFEGMNATPQLPSRQGLEAAILANCAGPEAAKGFDMRDRFAQQNCSSATYALQLLYGPEGLFAAAPQMLKTTVAEQVNLEPEGDVKISWTRGYLLQKFSR